jgi:peptidyl-prolyl cis-trans isomerase D
MSVLESMRSGRDSTFMQVIFFMVLVSFVGLGMGVYGDRTETVATVNGEAISAYEHARLIANEERRYEQTRDEAMTEDERQALRERVLQDLIRNEALLQEAKALGIEVSDAEIAEVLLTYDFLKDAEGRFDMRAYEQFLQRQRSTRGKFEQEIRESLMLQKLEGLMRLGASVSEPLVRQTYIEENTKLDIEFVRVRSTSFLAQVNPQPAEVDAWIAENQEALRAEYDRGFAAKYDLPEIVDLSVIRLAVQSDGLAAADLKPKIDAIVAELDGGADFAALARKWSEDVSAADGGSLGEQRVTQLEPDVATAIKDLEAGKLSKVVVGDRDLRVFRLESRTPARVIPIEEVQQELATQLMREAQAPVLAAAFAEEQLLARWKAEGVVPQDLIDAHDLRVSTTGPMSASGEGGGLFKPPAAMLKDARTAEAGAVLPEVYEDEGVLWVGRLASRTEADMSTFEQDRANIHERALLTRRAEFYRGWVDDVVARADVER